MKEFIYKNREKIFNIIVLIIYIIITGAVCINHENYENEAQSFLLARDLSIPQIISQLKYEGHSFLWYFVIFPFAKLGLPIQSQNFISWAFGIATVVLILKKTNINKFLKVLIIFSSGLLYFYTAIARTYAMIPLLLVLISIIYEKRDKHPYIFAILLALLANTHLIMIPTAVLLAVFYWGKKIIQKNININKKDFFLSLLIFIVGLTLFCIIIVLSITNMELVNNNIKVDGIDNFNVLYNKFNVAVTSFIDFLWGEPSSPTHVYILFGVAMLLCVIGLKDDFEQGIIFLAQFAFTIIIHSLFWITISERVIIIIYTLMFWVLNSTNKDLSKENQKTSKYDFLVSKNKAFFPTVALIILLGMNAYAGYKIVYDDINGNYSLGKEFAEYINENIKEKTTILCSFNTQYQPIVAYLPKDKYKFYLTGPQREATFVTWDKTWNEMAKK